jgi:hypothetical protein
VEYLYLRNENGTESLIAKGKDLNLRQERDLIHIREVVPYVDSVQVVDERSRIFERTEWLVVVSLKPGTMLFLRKHEL